MIAITVILTAPQREKANDSEAMKGGGVSWFVLGLRTLERLHPPPHPPQQRLSWATASANVNDARQLWKWLSLFPRKQQQGASVHAFLTSRRCTELVAAALGIIPSFIRSYIPQLHESGLRLPLLCCVSTAEGPYHSMQGWDCFIRSSYALWRPWIMKEFAMQKERHNLGSQTP